MDFYVCNKHMHLNLINLNACSFINAVPFITPLKCSMNYTCRTICVVHNINYLGIMLYANMSWKSHIVLVSNKLSRINGILHRLKYMSTVFFYKY